MDYKKGIILFTILLLITLTINQMDSMVQNDNLVVFIIDDRISPEVIDNKPVVYNNHITHGSIVARLIKKEVPAVKIYPLEVSNLGGDVSRSLYFSALREIINYSENNPEKKIIVNISLAFSDYHDLHHTLIKKLAESGVLIITAAGNSNSSTPPYPAGFEETVAVASADRGGKESYSNYGAYIDISAPGKMEETFRLYFAGGLKYNQIRTWGTSLAAPRVSGLTAKIMTLDKQLSMEEAYDMIASHSVDINDQLYKDGLLGAGVINKWGTLFNIDPFFFLRESSYLLVLVFISILIFLWFKHGVLSIFYTILITMFGMPVLLLLEELIYQVRKDGLQHTTMIFVLFVLMIIFAPLFFRWKKSCQLKIYLKSSYDVDVEKLLKYAYESEELFSIVKEYYRKNDRVVDQLLLYPAEANLDRKEIIKEILVEKSPEIIITKILNLLKNNSFIYKISQKVFLLEIIEEILRNKPFNNCIIRSEIENYSRKIISNTDEDMWMRFQALRTLYCSMNDKSKLLPYLKRLSEDNDELVSLEARGLLEDYFRTD
ncbi:MAG: S8 family peptidase [Halanaerobiales bacterium]